MNLKLFLSALITASICTHVSASTDFGVDYIYNPDFSTTLSLIDNGVEYTSIYKDAPTDTWFMTRADNGGVDIAFLSGSWTTSSIINGSVGTWNTLSTDRTVQNQVFAADAVNGGIDLLTASGGWGITVDGLVNNGVFYNDLATDQVAVVGGNSQILGTRADGGIDAIFVSGGWTSAQIINNGIDYTSITADALSANYFMATKASGGIDNIALTPGWTAFDMNNVLPGLNDTVFTSITAAGLEGQEYIASRADGGMDRIYLDGTWQRDEIRVAGTEFYNDLATNYTAADYAFGVPVPEPSTYALLAGIIGLAGAALRRRR